MAAALMCLMLLQGAEGPDAVLRRVAELGAQGEEEKALELLLEGTRRFPESPAVYFFWAGLYLRNNRPEPALAALEKTLSLAPAYPRAHFLKGVAHLKLGDFDRAIGELDAAVQESPREPEGLAYRGIARAAKQQFELAEADLRASRRLAPDEPAVLLALGKLLVDTGRAEEAVRVLQRLLEVDAGSAPGHYQLGRAWQALGRPERAEKAFAAARQIQEQARRRAAKDLAEGQPAVR